MTLHVAAAAVAAMKCRGDIKCMVPCRCISDAVACALLLLLLLLVMMMM